LRAAAAAYPEAEYLQMARDIAFSHHEKFDGTGYPTACAARKIPCAAASSPWPMCTTR